MLVRITSPGNKILHMVAFQRKTWQFIDASILNVVQAHILARFDAFHEAGGGFESHGPL
jgi:hypothetical protein